jgi:predicted regulator of Ras-like GTPase activity (Roadblock/LC7/MglB family)
VRAGHGTDRAPPESDLDPMTQFDQALSELREHDGVEHLLVLGGDGLLIRHLGEASALAVERVAAMIPGVQAACAALGRAAGQGEFGTAVLEYRQGVAIVAPLSADVLLGVLLRAGVGFAPLLRTLRLERERLAGLL